MAEGKLDGTNKTLIDLSILEEGTDSDWDKLINTEKGKVKILS